MTVLKKDNKFRVQREKNSKVDGSILAWVFDASEEPVPYFTPDWLYNILENIRNSSGGYYGELMGSLFEMDDIFYNNLITHLRCESYEEVNT